MNDSDRQLLRLNARSFAEEHLAELAVDLVAHRQSGVLPVSSQLHELRRLCSAYAQAGDDSDVEAEKLIEHFALEWVIRY